MIGEGTFKARGLEAELGTTDSGKEQVAVLLELLEGDDQGKHITWYGYFTEATTDRTLEALRLLGWQGDDLSDLRGIDANEVYAVIIHDEYDGKVRAKVNFINGNAGIALKNKMSVGDAKAFAERMKGHVLAQRQKQGQGGAAAQPAKANGERQATRPAATSQSNDFVANSGADDDIPF